jgi:hypothetical protein
VASTPANARWWTIGLVHYDYYRLELGGFAPRECRGLLELLAEGPLPKPLLHPVSPPARRKALRRSGGAGRGAGGPARGGGGGKDKIRKCRSADWERTEAENSGNAGV